MTSFYIDKQPLNEALGKLTMLIGAGTTLPVLGNVLIRAATESSAVEITSTNLDQYLTIKVPAKVEKSGAITLPAKRLAAIVSAAPTETIAFSGEDRNTMGIKSGGSQFKIMGLSADEFPQIDCSGDAALEMPAEQLRGALGLTAFAASTDDTRYILNGVHFAATLQGVSEWVGTDGRRMALHGDPVNGGGVTHGVIPSAAVAALKRILPQDGKVAISSEPGRIVFATNGSTLVTKLIEGNYPNYRQVLPGKAQYSIRVDREALSAVVRRVSLMTSEKTSSVRFHFRDSALEISAVSPEIGEALETLDVKYSGPEMIMAVDPRFVLEPLREMTGDEAIIELIAADRALVLRDGANEEFIYVLMPMRAA